MTQGGQNLQASFGCAASGKRAALTERVVMESSFTQENAENSISDAIQRARQVYKDFTNSIPCMLFPIALYFVSFGPRV